MITDAFGIVTVLILIEGLIFFLADHPRTQKCFDFLPTMFWIYFLPLLATTFHLIPQKSDVYSFVCSNLLPASLVLLLLSVDIRAIFRLGRVALLMMLAGSAGIILGGPIVLLIFRHWLPQGPWWSGFGALSGSWTGGSANMIAVAEAIKTPKNIFTPMVIVDAIVPYVWMALLMALVGFQKIYDRWNRSDTTVMDHLNAHLAAMEKTHTHPLTVPSVVLIFAFAFSATFLAIKIAKKLPVVPGVVTTYTWTIILVTTLSLLCSFTKIKKLESHGASKIGFALLYFVLAAIGAGGNLTELKSAPVLILAGFTWVLIHALFIFTASRLLKAPLFLAVTASQANIGGVASTPAVAAAYQPALASVGLLLAIFGNIVGTYFGIACAHLARWVTNP